MSLVLDIDDCDLTQALEIVAGFGEDRYGYIVTPNVDHIIRYDQNSQFRALYKQAAFVLLDSRFLAHTIGLIRRQILRVCLGSDLTTEVLRTVAKPQDRVVLVGGTAAQAQELRARFGLESLHHIDPPMKFIADPTAVEACLRDIEAASPFRFCFLAIGSPQQEIIAHRLQERGTARGLALCVGAAIDFITGIEQRAPAWMQRLGFEWFFRLLQNPKRMTNRYLVRGPRIFLLLPRLELRLRQRGSHSGAPKEMPTPASASAPAPVIISDTG